jgi:hypothetical protein
MTPEQIAKGLSALGKRVVRFGGRIETMPFSASVMRPLVRIGLFSQHNQKGFRARYEFLPLGLAVRAILEKQDD